MACLWEAIAKFHIASIHKGLCTGGFWDYPTLVS